jgi:hypothetical protein
MLIRVPDPCFNTPQHYPSQRACLRMVFKAILEGAHRTTGMLKKMFSDIKIKQYKNVFFSFTKTENRRAEQVLYEWLVVRTSGNGEDRRKGWRRMNMVKILCACI